MSLIPEYKEIIELLKKGLTLEAQEKIMELRVAALELQEENLKFRERIRQLEGELQLNKNLIFEAKTGLYWLSGSDGLRDGPFCAICRDKENKLVRLHDGRNRVVQTRWICMVCGKSFDGED